MVDDASELRSKICWMLLVVTAVVYWRVSMAGFVNYDDGVFVYLNSHVYTGLTPGNIKWAFATLNGDASSYHPLTWLTHQFDCQLFGLRAGAHHVTNLLFHLANTALLFILLDQMTGKVWRSAFVAGMFALHPLHAGTVAWVSERKSLVCCFFALLTIFAYLRYLSRRSVLNYFVILVWYVASLLSKPMTVTLPFTLLLLDFWPLGRLHLPRLAPAQSSESPCEAAAASRCNIIPLFIEKLPLFILAGLASWLSVIAQSDLKAIASLEKLPMSARVANSLVAYVLYLRKTLWPVDLAPIYPLRTDWLWWQVASCALFLFCVSFWMISSARRRPYLLVGWCWFLGTFLPVIGLVQIGSQGMADRYTYIPLIGLFITVIWGVSEAVDHIPVTRRVLATCGLLVVGVCAVSTFWQLQYWQNSIRLFDHAARVTDRNYLAYGYLGMALRIHGDLAESESNLRKSLAMHPGPSKAEMYLGETLFQEGKVEEALGHYLSALESHPADGNLHYDLANLFENSSDRKFHDPLKALQHARRACELTRYRKRDFLVSWSMLCAENLQYGEAKSAAQKVMAVSLSQPEIESAAHLMKDITRMELGNK